MFIPLAKLQYAMLLSIILSIFLITPSSSVYGQCDSAESVKEYADSALVGSDGEKRAVSIFFPSPEGQKGLHFSMNQIMPTFKFSITYPSLNSQISLLFNEFTLNGQKIGLKNWCKNQEIVGWDEQTHNAHTRTFDFTVKPDDEISFFRLFRYQFNNRSSHSTPSLQYLAFDDISWSIQLKDAKNNQTLVQLDTLITYRNTDSPKEISFWANRPLASVVSYRIPRGSSTSRVYLQVNIFKSAHSRQQFTRNDYLIAGLLSQKYKFNNFSSIKPDESKLSQQSKYLESKQDIISKAIKVMPNPSSGPISIQIDAKLLPKSIQNELTIKIVNTRGDVIVYQSLSQLKDNVSLNYDIKENGVYNIQYASSKQTYFNQQIVVNK